MYKRPDDLQIIPRQPDVDLRPLMRRQRYWLNGDPVLTHFVNALQATFPEGERFFIDSAERPVRDVLAWHALEECEHKAVCFDLYQCAGGGYFRRCFTLLTGLFDLFFHVHARHRYLLQTDGLWTWKTRWRVFRDIWGPRGVMGSMYGLLWRYLKPGFHPWDSDERAAFIKRYGELLPR